MATARHEERQLVGELLRAARVEAGLRQQDVAESLGSPQSFVSKYESGERYLSLMEARAICLALGISLGSFVERLEARLQGG
jgi:transcriptional regulator with XRE-family HTH domain